MGSRTDMIELGTPQSDNESMSMPQSCEDKCTKRFGRLRHFSRAFLAWFEVICNNQFTIKSSRHYWAKSEKTCGWDGEGIPISVIGRICMFHWVPTPKSAEILLWLKGFEQVLMKPMLPLWSYLSWNVALHSTKIIIWKRGFASLFRKEIHVKWRLPLQESLFVQVLFKTLSEKTCLQFREHFMSETYKQPEQHNQQMLSQTHSTLL